jgi:uncharacterized protein YraI
MRRSIKVLAGLLIGLAIPAAANAYPAWSSSGTNMRAGPGVAFPKVGYLPGGQRVEVFNCNYGWCQIQYAGYGGWIMQSRLRTPPPPPPRYFAPPPHKYPPPMYKPGPYMPPPMGYPPPKKPYPY